MSLTVDLPDEPPDRAVVLDRDANAWQHRGDSWVCGAPRGRKTWPHLVVDHGPLAPLLTEGDCPCSEHLPGLMRAFPAGDEGDEG